MMSKKQKLPKPCGGVEIYDDLTPATWFGTVRKQLLSTGQKQAIKVILY